MPSQFETAAFGANQIDADVTQQIALRLATESVVYSMLQSRGRILDTSSPEFTWYTDTMPGRRTAINNAPDDYDENTTSIVVDDGTRFAPNHLILFEATGEVGLVTAVATHTLTVIRGIGSVVAAAAGSVADNAAVSNIGYAGGEGGESPVANMGGQTEVKNNVQLFRTSVEITGTVNRTGQNTEDQQIYQRRKKLEETLRDIERAFLFGAKDQGNADAAGKKVRTTGGLFQAITTHVDNVGGTMTEARFYQFSEMAFGFGGGEKTLIAGGTLLTTLTSIYKDRLRFTAGDQVGAQIGQILTPHGLLNVVYNKLFEGVYAQSGIVLDMTDPNVQIRPLSNDGRLQLKNDIEKTGADAEKDEWFGELGLQYGDEANHAVIEGVTGAA